MITGLFVDLLVATSSNMPFSLIWKRCRCSRKGHVMTGSRLVDKLYSEHHPHTDVESVYTVALRECTCGLIFQTVGLEYRHPTWEREKIGEISE